jgi:hypothetical protein
MIKPKTAGPIPCLGCSADLLLRMSQIAVIESRSEGGGENRQGQQPEIIRRDGAAKSTYGQSRRIPASSPVAAWAGIGVRIERS